MTVTVHLEGPTKASRRPSLLTARALGLAGASGHTMSAVATRGRGQLGGEGVPGCAWPGPKEAAAPAPTFGKHQPRSTDASHRQRIAKVPVGARRCQGSWKSPWASSSHKRPLRGPKLWWLQDTAGAHAWV